MISKNDFLEWKSNPVTRKLFVLLTEWIEVGKDELSHVAGENPLTDRERVGKLNAFRDVLGVTSEDLEIIDDH